MWWHRAGGRSPPEPPPAPSQHVPRKVHTPHTTHEWRARDPRIIFNDALEHMTYPQHSLSRREVRTHDTEDGQSVCRYRDYIVFIRGGTAPRQNGARLEQPGGAAPATHGFCKPGAELRDWPSTWSFQTTVKRFQGAAAFVACTRSRSRCLFQALLQVPRGEREFFQPQPDP